MNIVFWSLLIAMLLVAIAILVYPLLRVRQQKVVAYRQSNLEINRQKLEELNRDLAEGRIDQAYYNSARDELDRELLIDIPEETVANASEHYSRTARQQPGMAIAVTIFVPAIAFLLYLDLGMHAASDQAFIAQQQAEPEQMSIEQMTSRLASRIRETGGTVEELAMLGRAYKHLGQFSPAADAFAAALEKDPENAQLMLELAEMLALKNNRVFDEPARELVMHAYDLEPDNPNSLWFAGVAQFQAENYRQAIALMKQLLPMAVGEEEVMKSVVNVVAQSRDALIAQGVDMPELAEVLGIQEAAASPESPASVASPVAQVVVNVDVDEAAREKFSDTDTVFVYARAQQGPRMPLAIQRITLGALPATVTLDDSMAMVEGMNLSAFDKLVVMARISPSGSAMAQAGDYMGSVSIELSALKDRALDVLINTPVQ